MTKSEIEKKARRNQILVGVVLVGLMILSSLGYGLISNNGGGGSGAKMVYNGITFYKNGNQWQASINGGTFNFLYSPTEVSNIQTPLTLSFNQFYNKPLYFDSDNPAANYEIAQNLQNYVLGTMNACLNASDCADNNAPIKTCASNVIVIRNSSQTSISLDGNCTYIYGGDNNAIQAGDAFLYKILGVTS